MSSISFREASEEYLLITRVGLREIVDFDQLTEDCFEVCLLDAEGEEWTVQLDDSELEDLAALEPELQKAWNDYVQAGHEVADEMAFEQHQMGMCDF